MKYLRLRWMVRTILQELRMRKYKAIARYFYDREYRADINRLRNELCYGKLKSQLADLQLGQIHFSHDINYPDWVLKLADSIQDGEPLPAIKVYWMRDRWVVIDGNHRLRAMKLMLLPGTWVKVRLLNRRYQ